MDKYSLQGHLARGSIKSFANEYVYQFIDQIARYGSEDLLPIDATYEECLAQLAYYWNVDPESYAISNEEFSVFGTPLFDLQPNRGQNIVGVQSLFENEEFTNHYLALNEYRLEAAYRFKYDASSDKYYEDAGEGKEIVFFIRPTSSRPNLLNGDLYDKGYCRFFLCLVAGRNGVFQYAA